MKQIILFCCFNLMISSAWAQPPLSKRDQQRKAEFEAMIEAEKNYESTISEADAAFRDKDYVKARMKYEEAIQYNPNEEQWLTSKVNDLDILMAKIIAREVDSVLVMNQRNIPKINAEVAQPKAATEMVAEQPKVELPPPPPPAPMEKEVEVVKTEIDVETTVAVEEEKPAPVPTPVSESKPAKKTPAPTPEKKEKKEEKVRIDYSKYPQGLTDETFEFPNHTVRRIIVKDGMDTIVYKYVTHSWGGKFYFKDGVSIVDRIWKQEVEAFKQKYPQE